MFDFETPLLAQADAAPGTPVPGGDAQPTSTQPGTPKGPPPNPLASPMFAFLLVIVVFYVVLFLGRGKKQKKFDKMLKDLQKNDRVVTIGGIVGTVMSTRGDEVVVKVDESSNIKMTFVRRAIQRVLTDADTTA